MKKYLFLLLFYLALHADTWCQGFANIHQKDPLNPEFVPGELIIKFKDELKLRPVKKGNSMETGIASVDEALSNYRVREICKLFPMVDDKSPAHQMPAIINPGEKAPRLFNIYRLFLDAKADITALASKLKEDPFIDFAEPNYLVYSMLTEPNDALCQSGNQWYLEEIGAYYAWDSVTGDTSQVIGIIDTGIDWDHPDLDGNIWRNWDEVPGNGFDDDYNGYIDDVRGWDFRNNDNNPDDDNGHGTHVAGVAGAETDNYTGIAGVAWHSRLMPLKVLSGTGSGNMADLATAIWYAANNGASVINMSLGSYGESQAVKAALLNAYSVLCPVAAAGNDSYKVDPVAPPNNTYAPMFPGCYPFVIGVEASMPEGSTAPFSNIDPSGFKFVSNDFGHNYEVMAPGVNIMSTFPGGTYRSLNGTSMAAPIVSGAVALLKNYKTGITNEEIFARIVQFSQDGNLKIPNLLTATLNPDLLYAGLTLLDTVGNADHDGMADAGEYIDLYFTIKNAGGFADSSWAKLSLNYPGDTASVAIIDSLSYIGNLDTASYGGEIPAYTTLTGERDPFRIYIKPGVINDKELVLNYEIGARHAFSKFGTIEITTINAREIYGVLDTILTIGPGKLWVINRSFKISPNGGINILPGTHFRVNKGFANYGFINGHGTKDSTILIDGSSGLGGGTINLSYAHILKEQPSYIFSNSFITMDHCLIEYFSRVFGSCQVVANDCIFREGGWIGMYGTFTRCIFDNCLQVFGPNTWINNNFSGFQSGLDSGIGYERSNNFATRREYFIYATYHSEIDTLARHQYWGTTDSVQIADQIVDFWDDPNLAQVFFMPILEAPTPEAHGFVWKVHVNGVNPQDGTLDPIGCGTIQFDVYFNKPMDIAFQPYLSFGVRYPYTQHIVENNASWNADSTIWTAYFDVELETGDGINSIRVSDAYDTEGFRVATEKNERFRFVIQAASSLATEFSAIPGIGKVYLEWPMEDLNDLMGFNMYRFMRINDSTTTDTLLINSELIADSVYIDYQVTPGSLYGYCYKMVGTDQKESDFSEVALAIPLLTANGDANGDQQINILDVTAMIAYILEQNPKPFLFEAADLNFDQDVDIRDMVLLLNLIRTGNPKSTFNGIMSLTPAYLEIQNDRFNLNSSGNLSAIQFVIEGTDLDKLDLRMCFDGYEFVFHYTPSKIIGLIFSFDNRIIDAGDMKLFSFTSCESSIESISATGSGPKGEYVPVMMISPGYISDNGFSVQLIPNPAYRGTTVKISTQEEGEIMITILNAEGRTIFASESLAVPSGGLDYYWNGSDPASGFAKPGIYICQVKFCTRLKEDIIMNNKLVLLNF